MKDASHADAAPRRGTFGWIGPRWEATADRVVVARRTLGLALMPLLAVGAWALAQPFTGSAMRRSTGNLYIALGMVAVVVGFAGLMAALWPPRRIEATADGLRWGGRRFAPNDVEEVRATARQRRTRLGVRTSWQLTVVTADARERSIALTDARGTDAPPELAELVTRLQRLVAAGRARAAGPR